MLRPTFDHEVLVQDTVLNILNTSHDARMECILPRRRPPADDQGPRSARPGGEEEKQLGFPTTCLRMRRPSKPRRAGAPLYAIERATRRSTRRGVLGVVAAMAWVGNKRILV